MEGEAVLAGLFLSCAGEALKADRLKITSCGWQQDMVEKEKVDSSEQWQISSDSDSFDDPLIDCIEIIAKIHDRPISRTVLRAGLPLVNNRLTIELVSRATRRAGMASRILKRSLADFRGYELPAIIILNGHRACVAVEAHPEEGTLRVIWPESQGSQVISIEELASIYSGYTIFHQTQVPY